MVKGTPSCISPEAAKGEQTSSASDIYSLGCVAFTLLTGGNVFEAQSVMPLLLKHISEEPKPPSQYKKDLPAELDGLVLSCLSKNPSDRPTAKQLREILDSISLDDTWDNEQATRWWAKHPFLREPTPDDDQSETVETGFTESTSKIPKKHPTEDELRLWMSGALSINRTTVVEKHLESCASCAEKIGNLGDGESEDEFVDHLRNVMAMPDEEDSIMTIEIDATAMEAQMKKERSDQPDKRP